MNWVRWLFLREEKMPRAVTVKTVATATIRIWRDKEQRWEDGPAVRCET